jgi:hypothetical protein
MRLWMTPQPGGRRCAFEHAQHHIVRPSGSQVNHLVRSSGRLAPCSACLPVCLPACFAVQDTSTDA